MEKSGISAQLLLRFGAHLRESEKAGATVEKYIRDVRGFAAFLGGREISKPLAIEYKRHLLAKGYAVRSVNSAIASLNCFFAFADKLSCRLKTLRLQRQTYCPEEKELSRREYEQLVAAAEKKGNERLCLILQAVCGTGIRISELQFLTVEALSRGEINVSCKGKSRRVFIVKSLKKRLWSYVGRRGISSGPIFRTRTGRPVSRTNIWREMKSISALAGVDPGKVFPHNLRHLFARIFYAIDRDIARLADILGHSSINTTRIYIVTAGSEHRRKMEQMRLII